MESQSEADDPGIRQIIRFSNQLYLILSLLLFYSISANSQSDSIRSQRQSGQSAESYLRNILEKSQSDSKQMNHRFEDIEIDQIMVNSMISKAGNDFFEAYSLGFEWPKSHQNFIVIVSERPFIASTTLVMIKVNDLEVFQNILQPRNAYLEELADYAQAITIRYINDYQQIMNELNNEDRSGSGIY